MVTGTSAVVEFREGLEKTWGRTFSLTPSCVVGDGVFSGAKIISSAVVGNISGFVEVVVGALGGCFLGSVGD
jgi:hypothetical protein